MRRWHAGTGTGSVWMAGVQVARPALLGLVLEEGGPVAVAGRHRLLDRLP